MGRERGEEFSLDLFSTNTGRDDPSPPPPKPPDTDKTTGGDSRRYVLPNNLHDAVKYLNDEELDSLRVATLRSRSAEVNSRRVLGRIRRSRLSQSGCLELIRFPSDAEWTSLKCL